MRREVIRLYMGELNLVDMHDTRLAVMKNILDKQRRLTSQIVAE